MTDEVKKEIKPVVFVEEKELREALKDFLANGGELKIDKESKSWIARKNGAEDSGSLSIPLQKIVRLIFEGVSRGARKPVKIRGGDLDGAFVA